MGITGRRVAGATVVMALALPALAACDSSAPGHAISESCVATPSTPSMKIALTTIHANVWNAAGKTGQAASVASQLSWRGVHIIDTGNDPVGGEPPKHAEIRYGANGKQIALTLAQQIKDATLQQDDRTNPSVDVVIGSNFSLVPVPPPAPSKITVNVYNAYVIPGAASQLASTLRKRGFTVAKVANDTSDFYPDHAAIVRYGVRGEPAARRLALQFHDVRMVQDHRKGTTIDIVIGSKWSDGAVVPAAQATVPPKPSPTTPTCTMPTKTS